MINCFGAVPAIVSSLRHKRAWAPIGWSLCWLTLLTPMYAQQTDAQRALANEPEMRAIRRSLEDYQARQNLPPNDIRKPGAFDNLFDSYIGMKGTAIGLERIRYRLERKVYNCLEKQTGCPWLPAQEELSELLRQEEREHAMSNAIGASLGASDFVTFLNGNDHEYNRWQHDNGVMGEGEGLVELQCDARYPMKDLSLREQRIGCYGHEEGEMKSAEQAHPQAWSACFKKHDWVKTPAERKAYEECLDTTDPLVEFCNKTRKAFPTVEHCPTEVTSMDISPLLEYRFYKEVPPEERSAQVQIIPGSAVHVTLLEPLVTPDMPAPPPGRADMGGKVEIRARVDNVVEGNSRFVPGTVAVIPPGTEVTIQARLGPAGGQRTNATLMLSTQKAALHDGQADQLFSQPMTRQIPWPQTGSVLIPANTPLTFTTKCGCLYPKMTQGEFSAKRTLAASAPNANESESRSPGFGKGKAFGDTPSHPSTNSPVAAPAVSSPTGAGAAADVPSRPIVVGSQMKVVLLEPITVSGIKAGKRFHAQLKVDMKLPRSAAAVGALQLPQGTDVYLKVTDQSSGAQFAGHNAELAIDYVVVQGQQVAIVTPPQTHTFTDQTVRPPHSLRPPIDSTVWPAGDDDQWFTVTEQAEVLSGAAGNAAVPAQQTAIGATSAPAEVASLRIYAGSRISLVLVDPIDTSAQPGKLFQARLSEPMSTAGIGRHPDMLDLPGGTEVYLKALQKNTGSPSHTAIDVTVDHIVLGGSSIPVATTTVTKSLSSTSSASQVNQIATRSLGALGRQLASRIPQGASPSNSSVNSTLPSQTKLVFTVNSDVTVPSAGQSPGNR